MTSINDDFLREMFSSSPFQAQQQIYMPQDWHQPRSVPTDNVLTAETAGMLSGGNVPVPRYTHSNNYRPISTLTSRHYPHFRPVPDRQQPLAVPHSFHNQQAQSYNDLYTAYPPSPSSPLSATMHSMYQSERLPIMALQAANNNVGAITPTTPASFGSHGEDMLHSRGIRPFEVEFPNFQGDGRNKPPYPYVELISYAINSHPSQKMALSEIYNWLLVHFPWFQTATSNWRNSVRHNLSLNKKFVRVPREAADGVGKGDLWTVEPMAELAPGPARNRRKSSAAKVPYERKKSNAVATSVQVKKAASKPTRRLSQAAPARQAPVTSPAAIDLPEVPPLENFEEEVLAFFNSQPPTPYVGHPLSCPLPAMEGSSESLESLLVDLA